MRTKPAPKYLVRLAALMTLGSGVINLVSVLHRASWSRHTLLQDIFPLEFVQLSRFLALLMGFALIVSSLNVYKRKKRAFWAVLLLSAFSIVFHVTKGLDYQEAAFSLLLVAVLLAIRKSFTVKSEVPRPGWTVLRLGLAVAVAVAYGVLGFWFLDRRHFGIDFNMWASIRNTLSILVLNTPAGLVPRTRYAHWFLNSLDLVTITTILYVLFTLFRPVIYRLATLPHERSLAEGILDRYGRSSLDAFKVAPDKAYFFSPSEKGFLSYRMGGRCAVVLADPVGPAEEIPVLVRDFRELCDVNDWKLVFHQVLPDFLEVYRASGFKKLKVGDEAVVDLTSFSLEGKGKKHLRHYAHQLEAAGYRAVSYEAPLPDDVLDGIQEVSDDWLKISGRRERTFTLAPFSRSAIRTTPVFAALGPDGRIEAFMNIVRDYAPGETTIDLMRHRREAPGGIMDYLFIKLFEDRRRAGFRRFSLGLAPMAGFQEHEEPSREERAVHVFLQRMNFLFSYAGLLRYKKKFATSWEPRYTIYRNVLDLPRVAIAIARVSELRGRGLRALDEVSDAGE
jgi:phosphatidylglycerol lysyltransferase